MVKIPPQEVTRPGTRKNKHPEGVPGNRAGERASGPTHE